MALDDQPRPDVAAVPTHLPQILDEAGKGWERCMDADALQAAFFPPAKA
jgi:hypothetical protein